MTSVFKLCFGLFINWPAQAVPLYNLWNLGNHPFYKSQLHLAALSGPVCVCVSSTYSYNDVLFLQYGLFRPVLWFAHILFWRTHFIKIKKNPNDTFKASLKCVFKERRAPQQQQKNKIQNQKSKLQTPKPNPKSNFQNPKPQNPSKIQDPKSKLQNRDQKASKRVCPTRVCLTSVSARPSAQQLRPQRLKLLNPLWPFILMCCLPNFFLSSKLRCFTWNFASWLVSPKNQDDFLFLQIHQHSEQNVKLEITQKVCKVWLINVLFPKNLTCIEQPILSTSPVKTYMHIPTKSY